MAINSQIGTKVADFARRESNMGIRLDSGPYLGKIKNNIDPARLGRVQVYIPENGGLDEEDPQSWRTVSYSSPYFGATMQASKGNVANEYGTTKESYGMWMTPPDIGVLVICIFINGDPTRGYYIGCIPDATSHHMVPGLAGNARAKTSSLTSEQQSQTNGETFLPVVEFNDKIMENALDPDFYNNVEKPVHAAQLSNFARQGLVKDHIRGIISSSSQRESPSAVFGISTPGRKISGDPEKTNHVWMREGGHSFVMDDGTLEGSDNLVRLRTSGGHQLMLNDSAGIIHIITAGGKNWIELGADGSIRIFAASDISVNSKKDINFNCGGKFNVNAASINLKASGDVNLQSAAGMTLNSGAGLTAVAAAKMGLGSSSLSVASNSGTISCSGDLGLVGGTIKLNSGAGTSVAAPPAIPAIGIIPTAEPWSRPSGTTTAFKTPVAPPPAEKREVANSKTPAASPKTNKEGGKAEDSEDATTSATTTKSLSATEKQLSKQPAALGGVGPLSAAEIKVLFADIAASESSGDYAAENSLGYSGKYQFGVQALESCGYVKPGTWESKKSNKALRDATVWTGKDGISSQQDWFSSKGTQEQAMHEYTKKNHSSLMNNGGIRNGDDPATVAGMLKSAHLLGAGGAAKWRKGGGGADANGTTGGDYFAQASNAMKSLA